MVIIPVIIALKYATMYSIKEEELLELLLLDGKQVSISTRVRILCVILEYFHFTATAITVLSKKR